MDLLKALRSAAWERIFIIALIILILFGLATKLYLSTKLTLNSDTVGIGLESMEIGRHGNYLLSGYYVTAADTFFFTELIPFQLIPQVLTNYDPLALKLVVFVIFLLNLLVLSYIVYFVSGSYISALLFAALAANIPADGYWQFAMPTTHNATILFCGIVLVLLLYLHRQQSAGPEKPENRKKPQVPAAKVPWKYLLVLLVLVFTTALSDTIFLVWLIVPFLLVYIFFYKHKNDLLNKTMTAIAVLSAAAYVIKTYLIPDWVAQPFVIRDLSDILNINLPLFFKAQASFLNKPLFDISAGSFTPGLIEIISIVAFVVVIAYAIYGISSEGPGRKQFFYLIMAASIAVMFLAFLVSEYARDLGGSRYLTFTALAVLMVVAVSYNKKYPLFGLAVLLLLITSAFFTITFVMTASLAPNANEYALIDYLEANNLTVGFGTYWDSNVVTYLSGEAVTIRSADYAGGHIYFEHWLNCERWYQNLPSRAFIIRENASISSSDREGFNALLKNLNASAPLYYGQYDIYPYNVTG
ncbi:MAG: hypothetical protein WBZ29_00500 [Methanocella sp.]